MDNLEDHAPQDRIRTQTKQNKNAKQKSDDQHRPHMCHYIINNEESVYSIVYGNDDYNTLNYNKKYDTI